MLTDLATMFLWSIFLFSGACVTAHLHRHMGVLTASQASIMTITALLDVRLLKLGSDPVLALLPGLVLAAGLGVLQLAILLQTGAALFLVMTVIAQLVLVEIWYAVPQLTGGSGGILLPRVEMWSALAGFALLLVASFWYWRNFVARPAQKFDWACMKSLGPKAAAFGVPATRHYALGLALYGAVLGATGIAATRVLGYLTVNSFGLTWALATLMIVLTATKKPVLSLMLLAICYCSIRVWLRQSVHASQALSHAFEILFPLALLLILKLKDVRRFAHASLPMEISN